ncbi:hypothetical protein THIOKS12340001 [Thiocapsa sp. KS1]|nr:hypothetical protein THIOKS12340001 [Thiocapsa sp. KS1]
MLPDATIVRARPVEEDDCKSSIPGARRFATLLPADRMCREGLVRRRQRVETFDDSPSFRLCR